MNIPYLVGRRPIAKTPVSDQHSRDTSSLRAEDDGRTALRTMGWGIATFGAGAILGWAATRKSSAREPGNDAS